LGEKRGEKKTDTAPLPPVFPPWSGPVKEKDRVEQVFLIFLIPLRQASERRGKEGGEESRLTFFPTPGGKEKAFGPWPSYLSPHGEEQKGKKGGVLDVIFFQLWERGERKEATAAPSRSESPGGGGGERTIFFSEGDRAPPFCWRFYRKHEPGKGKERHHSLFGVGAHARESNRFVPVSHKVRGGGRKRRFSLAISISGRQERVATNPSLPSQENKKGERGKVGHDRVFPFAAI